MALSNRCLQCGNKLPLFRKVTGGEFCCEEHKQAFAHEQSNRALSRLIDEQQGIQAGRKPRRRGIALPLPRAANGNGTHAKAGAQAAQDPAFCQWLYASNPKAQNYKVGLRGGATSLMGAGELTKPSVNWRILRKRLMQGAGVEWVAAIRPRDLATAYAFGEGHGEFAAGSGLAMPAYSAAPEWEQPEILPELDFEPDMAVQLLLAPVSVKARDWTAPMRSSLAKPRAGAAWTPALPAHAEARVHRGMGGVELVPVQTAPLIRNSRLLGKAIPSSMGYRPIPAEHRPWEATRQVPMAPVAISGATAPETGLSSLSLLAARGPLGIKALLEGGQLVSSQPVFPQATADFNGLGLNPAGGVAIPTRYASAGTKPVQTQVKGIFPLPFLVPPLSPVIARACFRAPLGKVRQLTLAPRRGVESYQVSCPRLVAAATPGVSAGIPESRLKPILDWLPAFGRPMAPSWEVRAQRMEALDGVPSRGVCELVMTQAPALATSVLSIEQPAFREGPVKLLRLTQDRVEMRNQKSRPMANTETHAPVREVLKPRTRLVPRTLALEANPYPDQDAPAWRRKLSGMGQAWRQLPPVPKWGGLMAAALVLAVGLGTQGSYTAEAVAVRPAVIEPMGGESNEGGLAGIQKTILNRAAIALTDDFRAGLAEWEGQGDWARSWSYDAAGFVRTGSLAMYTPTLSLTDYRLEFLGQIERRSMSWVVRAKDFRNFYAVKLTLRDDGPVPAAYVQRYAVIDGQPTEVVQKRLPMQVTQDTLYRVLMEVRQENYVLTVQGQIVDSWSEQRLKSGGVGFFSAKGELARLRWVGVWHQYDALGRLCAFLAPYSISDRERSGGQ